MITFVILPDEQTHNGRRDSCRPTALHALEARKTELTFLQRMGLLIIGANWGRGEEFPASQNYLCE